jgi:uncharacterized protein (DUF433 family)
MTNTAKRKAYLAKAEQARMDKEPKLSEDNYNRDILIALNYYNSEYDAKTKKTWALDHLAGSQPQLADKISKVDDYYFNQYGVLCRLMTRGQVLSEAHIGKMKELLDVIKTKIPMPVAATPAQFAKTAAAVVGIQERILEKSREFAGEVDGDIDDFIQAGCPKDFKIKTPIKAASPPILKYLSTHLAKTAKELSEAIEGNDAQLVEGYSHLKKVELKRYLAFIESLIQTCQQQVVVAKGSRKPRARKAKPAAVVAAKVKYMATSEEFKIKSEVPAKMVDSEEVWIFNTKTRKLTVYKPANGGLLGIKGTTITNFDIAASMTKTLRKPELVKDYATLTKRPLNTAFKALTTKPSVPNGRINEECIILKVF